MQLEDGRGALIFHEFNGEGLSIIMGCNLRDPRRGVGGSPCGGTRDRGQGAGAQCAPLHTVCPSLGGCGEYGVCRVPLWTGAGDGCLRGNGPPRAAAPTAGTGRREFAGERGETELAPYGRLPGEGWMWGTTSSAPVCALGHLPLKGEGLRAMGTSPLRCFMKIRGGIRPCIHARLIKSNALFLQGAPGSPRPACQIGKTGVPLHKFSLDKRLDSLYNATQYSKCNDRENVAASISESRRVL